MIRDFTEGISAVIRAIGQVGRYKLWPYLFLSGFISLAVGGSIFWTSYSFASTIGSWISGFYTWDFGSGFISTLTNWISGLAILVGGFMVFKYIILIILSPIMSMMSEKIESQIRGSKNTATFSVSKMMSDLLRGINISLRNLTKELLITFSLFLLSFIPGLGIVTAPLILLTQVYFVGFGNLDYTMERHFDVRGAKSFVKRHRGLAIANGLAFTGLLLIPVLGLFVAPTLATIAGTTTTIKRIEGLNLESGSRSEYV